MALVLSVSADKSTIIITHKDGDELRLSYRKKSANSISLFFEENPNDKNNIKFNIARLECVE